MENKMINQNYLVIENNVVTNIVVWNGDVNTWQPPAEAIMLIQAETPAKTWTIDSSVSPSIWVETEALGTGDIGFTWDGNVLTTDKPEPPKPKPNQAKTTGTTTI